MFAPIGFLFIYLKMQPTAYGKLRNQVAETLNLSKSKNKTGSSYESNSKETDKDRDKDSISTIHSNNTSFTYTINKSLISRLNDSEYTISAFHTDHNIVSIQSQSENVRISKMSDLPGSPDSDKNNGLGSPSASVALSSPVNSIVSFGSQGSSTGSTNGRSKLTIREQRIQNLQDDELLIIIKEDVKIAVHTADEL
jgi:hypothetical protein